MPLMCPNTPDQPSDPGDGLEAHEPVDHHIEEILCALAKLAGRDGGEPPLPERADG